MKDSSILFTGAQAEQQTPQNRRRPARITDWIAEHPALAAFPFVLCAALLLWEGLVRWQELSDIYSAPPSTGIAQGAGDGRRRFAAAAYTGHRD